MPSDWRNYTVNVDTVTTGSIQLQPPHDVDYELVVAPTLSLLVERVKEKLTEKVWTVQGGVVFVAGQYIQPLARTTA